MKKRCALFLIILAVLVVLGPFDTVSAAVKKGSIDVSAYKAQGMNLKWKKSKKGYLLKKYKGTEADVTVPEGVVVINAGAFAGLSTLESVRLPSTLKTIKTHAFRECDALKAVDMPEKVKLGAEVFIGCPKLNADGTPKPEPKVVSPEDDPSLGLDEVPYPELIASYASAMGIGNSDLTCDKVRKAHDWLIMNTKLSAYRFREQLNTGMTTYMTVLSGHVASDYAYADTFKAIMNHCGIPCLVVMSSSIGHAWNIVKMDDGCWYHVDLTADDPSSNLAKALDLKGYGDFDRGELSHRYFLRSTTGLGYGQVSWAPPFKCEGSLYEQQFYHSATATADTRVIDTTSYDVAYAYGPGGRIDGYVLTSKKAGAQGITISDDLYIKYTNCIESDVKLREFTQYENPTDFDTVGYLTGEELHSGNRIDAVKDAGGTITVNVYDSSNNLIRTVTRRVDRSVTDIRYDSKRRKISETTRNADMSSVDESTEYTSGGYILHKYLKQVDVFGIWKTTIVEGTPDGTIQETTIEYNFPDSHKTEMKWEKLTFDTSHRRTGIFREYFDGKRYEEEYDSNGRLTRKFSYTDANNYTLELNENGLLKEKHQMIDGALIVDYWHLDANRRNYRYKSVVRYSNGHEQVTEFDPQ